jgi:hypothetical protein
VISPENDLNCCTLTVMKRMIQLVLTAGLLSSTALAQTTDPAPVTPAALPAATAPASNPFGVSLTAGLNPSVLTVALDYDVTSNFNLRFGVSPSPQVLELGVAYAFRTTPDWRIYGIAGSLVSGGWDARCWARVAVVFVLEFTEPSSDLESARVWDQQLG